MSMLTRDGTKQAGRIGLCVLRRVKFSSTDRYTRKQDNFQLFFPSLRLMRITYGKIMAPRVTGGGRDDGKKESAQKEVIQASEHQKAGTPGEASIYTPSDWERLSARTNTRQWTGARLTIQFRPTPIPTNVTGRFHGPASEGVASTHIHTASPDYKWTRIELEPE